MLDHKTKSWLLVTVSILAIVVLCFVGRIPQDPGYHHFADSRQFAGIDNFWNVFSNLPFLLIGLFGMWRYPPWLFPRASPDTSSFALVSSWSALDPPTTTRPRQIRRCCGTVCR